METIPFLVSLPDEEEQVKGIFSADTEIAVRDLPVDRLRENLNIVCQGFACVFNDVKRVGNFRLKQVTIQVEVTAEGGIELIGTAKLGGKGAITLTFSE
jgi:hypothetical protein